MVLPLPVIPKQGRKSLWLSVGDEGRGGFTIRASNNG